jgi:hypothetical protein
MNYDLKEIIENVLFLIFLGIVTWFALVIGNI